MQKAKKTDLIRLVSSGLWAAIVTVATIVIAIPTPTRGYVNLGDCFVDLGALILGGPWGAAAAAVGSAIADLAAGYSIYAPASFIIKGLMALVSFGVFKALSGKKSAPVLGALAAELVMLAGYFFFESAIYGSFAAAAPGLLPNAFQGAAGVVGASALYAAFGSRIKTPWKR